MYTHIFHDQKTKCFGFFLKTKILNKMLNHNSENKQNFKRHVKLSSISVKLPIFGEIICKDRKISTNSYIGSQMRDYFKIKK